MPNRAKPPRTRDTEGRSPRNPKRLKVVILGGGAAFGAHQAGALDYLVSTGVRPDALIGSSVGIVNALTFASGGADLMLESWRSLNSLSVLLGPSLRHNPLWGNSLMSMDRMVEWMEKTVDFERVFSSEIELRFVLLNLSTGRAELRGNRTEENAEDFRTVSHIGYRIPILYPPIQFKGDFWCDGGFVWNIPLAAAAAMGAAEVYILSVIRKELPRQERFSNIASVANRMLEVMWATAGNSNRQLSSSDGKADTYKGVRVIDIEPSEYLGANPVQVLWSTPQKAERLIEMGRRDAEAALQSAPRGAAS